MSGGLETSMMRAKNAERRGDFAAAASIYGAILARFPRNPRALDGLRRLRHAEAKHPPGGGANAADVNRLMALYQSGCLAQVVEQGEPLAARHPGSPTFPSILGAAYIGLEEFGKAEAALARAASLDCDNPEISNNYGIALASQGRLDEAVAAYRRALSTRPDYPEAHYNLGNALSSQGKLSEATASFRRAISLNAGYAEAHCNLGNVLRQQQALAAAAESYQRAVALKPDFMDAYNNLGAVHREQGQLEQALASYKRALSIKPDAADILQNVGDVLMDLAQLDAAIKAYGLSREIAPGAVKACAQQLYARAQICDFSVFDDYKALADRKELTPGAVPPFTMLIFEDDPERQLAYSRAWSAPSSGRDPLSVPARPKTPAARLRIGYFSADFHDHATLRLMAGLFREHDRQRFEISAFSYGPASGDAMRTQLVEDVEHFLDVREMADAQIVELARGLDIAVDLKGYTQHSRFRLFVQRMAPIQIGYLGYPGSMGADFIDYLIADHQVIPRSERGFYSEKIICLPGCYQPNDDRRIIAHGSVTRAGLGLPADAFIFCCFNHNYKIGPREFDVWMRLLAKVDHSVLWLLRSNEWAEANLRKEAEARGVDPARLLFADKLPPAEHLARLALADLFLDTFHVNAHTTASDALWAGLPVLTSAGRQFAARVGASLLNAIGVPELVTATEAEYEARALELATAPQRLTELRARLAANRPTHPLFDTAGYARRLEAAYVAVHQRCAAGLPPDHLSFES